MPVSFFVLIGFQLLGEIAQRGLHLPLPGPDIGVFLLAGTLLYRQRGETLSSGPRPTTQLTRTANGLITHMGLLFVPAGVGNVTQGALLRQQWLPVVVGIVGSTEALSSGSVDNGVICGGGGRIMMSSAHSIWTPLALTPLLWLCATLGAYSLGTVTQTRFRSSALANPVLIGIGLIVTLLYLTRSSYATYFAGAQLIHVLLGPATVALAIPLVNNFHHVRRSLRSMRFALLAGSLTSAVSGIGLARLLGGTRQLALSIAPEAVTTPIAMAIAAGIVAAAGVARRDSLAAAFAALGIGLNGLVSSLTVPVLVHLTAW